jgi:flagellar biosynthetic protein FlhB
MIRLAEAAMPALGTIRTSCKGVDAVARKIREVAGEHAIPIVENPPLARALHATVEIEQEIPAEHYQAVAEVISYVMRLKRGFARRN